MMRSLTLKLGRAAALAAIVGVGVLGVPSMVSAAGPLDGLTIPPVDPALVFVTPSVNQPNYDARLQAFLEATVPDTWNGQPVQFLSTLNDTGVDQLGLPTSEPAADPHNPQFIYQRFQNGVLFYNAAAGATSVLPLS
ncbi:MAG: hypothetical protein JO352_04985 [Chloroflexi bacterium]|nr:hypothetical protein [Chloroflexota bacterium]MBV9595871.1 hypothetical protein [Chloroflexota bacterium]